MSTNTIIQEHFHAQLLRDYPPIEGEYVIPDTLPELETKVHVMDVYTQGHWRDVAILSDRDHPHLKDMKPRPKLSWYNEGGNWLGILEEVYKWKPI